MTPPSTAGRAPIIPVTGSKTKGGAGTPAGSTAKAAAIRSTYKVQKGDTLSSISRTVYGDTRYWTLIRDANPDLLHGGSSVRVGTTLKIPARPGTAKAKAP